MNWSQIARQVTPNHENKFIDKLGYDGELKPRVLLMSSHRRTMSMSSVPMINRMGKKIVTCANHEFLTNDDVLTMLRKLRTI